MKYPHTVSRFSGIAGVSISFAAQGFFRILAHRIIVAFKLFSHICPFHWVILLGLKASFSLGVSLIIHIRTLKQVVWADAFAVIALMANQQCGPLVVSHQIANSVSAEGSAFSLKKDIENAIAVVSLKIRPFPAIAFWAKSLGLIDIAPKSLNILLSQDGQYRINFSHASYAPIISGLVGLRGVTSVPLTVL